MAGVIGVPKRNGLLGISNMFPKCFPYWIVDNKKIENPLGQGVAYTGRGFLLPCCWCDNYLQEEDFKNLGFFNDSIKVENVNNIEQDILMSDTWSKFRNNLLTDNMSEIPYICKQKCKDIPT